MPEGGVLVLVCANLRLWTTLTHIAVACIGLSEGDFEPYRLMAIRCIDRYRANPCKCDECIASRDDGELRRLRAYLNGSA